VYIATILGILALAGGLMYRARRLRTLRTPRTLTDDMVRQIEESGHIDVDEPLDLEEIQDEEARFWEEQPWEETDEY
jgi:hypothetical protein